MNINYKTLTFKERFCLVSLFVMLLSGFATSCKDSEEEETKEQYIVTNAVKTIGITCAELSGEFYSDKLPALYNNGTYARLGMEISLSQRFDIDNTRAGYVDAIQGTHFWATIYGLSPNTEYFFRVFVDVGDVKLYGETVSFTTKTMELPCSVGDATNVKFFSAELPVSFPSQESSSIFENLSYGIAYSTDKDIFTKIHSLLDTNGKIRNDIQLVPVEYSQFGTKTMLNKLQSKTTYYYCAYMAVGVQQLCQFGPVKSFTTENIDGLLSIDAIDAKFVYVEVSGTSRISDNNLSYKLVCELADMDWALNEEATMTLNGNNLTAMVTNLKPNHQYRCWIAVMEDGNTIFESEKKEFKTDNPSNYILLDDATNVTATSATISCRLTAEGFNNRQYCSIYYGQDKNNLINLTTAGNHNGNCETTLTGLQPNTTYYYCAKSLFTERVGLTNWYSSEIKSFTTLP